MSIKVLNFLEFVKIYESENYLNAVGIGDSSIPLYTSNVPELKVQYPSLQQGGRNMYWLEETLRNYRGYHPEVNLVFIGMGSNDNNYVVNQKMIQTGKEIKKHLDKIFPNAKFIVVKGGWGWGSLKVYTGEEEPDQLKDYYQRVWTDAGFRVTKNSQGYQPQHHQSKSPGIIKQSKEIRDIILGNQDLYKVDPAAPEGPTSEKNLEHFYDVLQKAHNESKTLNQQYAGNYTFSPEVEAIQVALEFLYPGSLPVYGVDGLYGPETESAIQNFKKENQLETGTGNFSPQDITALIEVLKNKKFSEENLKKIWDMSYSSAFSTPTPGSFSPVTGGDQDYLEYLHHNQGPAGAAGLIKAYLGEDKLHPSTSANSGKYLTNQIYIKELIPQVQNAVNSGDHQRAAALFLGYLKDLWDKKEKQTLEVINKPQYKDVKDAIDRAKQDVGSNFSSDFLYTTANVESGLNPNSGKGTNPMYGGLFAMTEEAMRKYGGDRFNAYDNAKAAIQSMQEGSSLFHRIAGNSLDKYKDETSRTA